MTDLYADFNREDKQEICNLLAVTLKATRNCYDIVGIEYEKTREREVAIVSFEGGTKRVINVALDSGTAMIRDIMKHLGC